MIEWLLIAFSFSCASITVTVCYGIEEKMIENRIFVVLYLYVLVFNKFICWKYKIQIILYMEPPGGRVTRLAKTREQGGYGNRRESK
jgi:uncharacterized membrane protein YcfT